jgi:TolB-like protein/Tfp pilus assembly protein PilF
MDKDKVLESWKEIAVYLGREVRTCQRWERELGLPVHRLDGSPRARVFAHPAELDRWLDEKLHERESRAEEPQATAPQADLRTRRRRRKGLIVALSIAPLATLALLTYVHLTRSNEPGRDVTAATSLAPGSWITSIAVLPFEDLSPDSTLQYRCESLADNIATKLGSIGALKVASRGSTRRLAGKAMTPGDIWGKLKVGTALEATLQTQDDLLRVNARLVRTQDGVCFWSHSYSGANEDMLKIEDEISRDVAVELGVELTPENRARSKRRDPKDDKNYNVFLLGRYFENRYLDYDEEEDFRKAADYLTAYVEANPDYALAYCSLGNIYEHRFVIKDNPEDKNSMRLCYEKAHQLDPELEETNLGMGWLHFYRHDFDRSYEYFRRAVALGPDNPEVNWNVGSFLRSIGLDEKAVPYYEKTLVFDPLNSVIHRLCAHSYMYIGQYEKGLGSIDEALALDRENPAALVLSARLLLLLNRPEEAVLRLRQLPDEINYRTAVRALWALISAVDEDREKALALLREIQLPGQETVSQYYVDVASAYSLLEMKNEAVQTIEEGIKRGFAAAKMELYSYPLLRSYPYFETLRKTPQFKAVERRQKELYEARLEKYKGL